MRGRSVILLLVLSWAVFWPLTWHIPVVPLFETLNAVGVVLGSIALMFAGPGIVRTFYAKRPMPGEYYFVLSIISAWIAILTRSLTLAYWRWHGEPAGWLDGFAMSFAAYVTITAAVLLLIGVALRRREMR
jgi:hypothetical protein